MTVASLCLAAIVAACGGGGAGWPTVPLDLSVPDLEVSPGPETGSVVLRFTAPGTAGDPAPDAYVVRASRRHITPSDQVGSSSVPVTATPSSPGTSEALTVRNLEPGRTLQFTVQAMRSGITAPVGVGAGGRVTGRDVPAPPSNALLLKGPATLSERDATYLLTQDITTSGTAFVIDAPGITLDLGGHRVTYGGGSSRRHAILAEYPGASSATPTIIRNGTIVQAATTATYGHAVFLRGVRDVRVSYLDVTVSGPSAHGIFINEAGDVRVDHCTVACRVTQVVDRHYPGANAILVEQATGTVELDENLVTASPQWGLRVRGDQTDGALIHHNRVIGTKALVANAYMLGIHAPNVEVYENLLRGESRGIHIDGHDETGTNARVHDNHVTCQDQPNPEYPDKHWAHGIKIEGAPGCLVEHNVVRGVADDQHGDVYALDLDLGDAPGVVVRHNRFEALSVTSMLAGHAVQWSFGGNGTSTDVLVHENVLEATDALVFRSWDAVTGGLFWGNWYHRDFSQGAEHAFDFEYFWNSDSLPSRGHRFVDPHPPALTRDVGQRAGAAAYESARDGTLTIRVADGAAPVASATVTLRDADGTGLWQGTTDAEGLVAGIVRHTVVTNGPVFDDLGPHRVQITTPGRTAWEGTVTVEGRTALSVDLGTGQAAVDDTAPSTPTDTTAQPLSASRALVLWTAATDDVGVASYLVYLDGTPWAITTEAGVYLGGLEADTSYVVTVAALDAGGNEGARSAGTSFRTRPEDRGP